MYIRGCLVTIRSVRSVSVRRQHTALRTVEGGGRNNVEADKVWQYNMMKKALRNTDAHKRDRCFVKDSDCIEGKCSS